MAFANGRRFVVVFSDWFTPVAVSYGNGFVRAAGRVVDIDEYQPRRVVDTQQQRV